jgi:hypothetical protein
MQIDKLVELHPHLYHMAEKDSWPNIKAHGLWSTSALLDRHKITGTARVKEESQHRPNKTTLSSPNFATTVLRDQKPMSETKLANCLQDGLTPKDWYELLNKNTFFWVDRERLLTLLNARTYCNDEHDVLTLDTKSLVHDHAQVIHLCHMNSGCTSPYGTKRGNSTFTRISDYPTRKNGNPIKRVVELVVEYGVADINKYVIEVHRMRGGTILGRLA